MQPVHIFVPVPAVCLQLVVEASQFRLHEPELQFCVIDGAPVAAPLQEPAAQFSVHVAPLHVRLHEPD